MSKKSRNKKRRERGKSVSKIISITPELAEEYTKEFCAMIFGAQRVSDGKISYNKILPNLGRKATVYMTPKAWVKQCMLLANFSKEVAWHGVARRYGEDIDTDEYIIEDIVVYPQTVTGATVDMDEAEYAKWLMENDEDERFMNLRMQGHSHVNMGTSPSSTDLNHQETILDMLGADDFYIFMIYNKRLEKTVKIYDMAKNIMFDNADITVETLLDDVDTVTEFLKSSKQLVKELGYSGSYGSSYSGSYNNYKKPEEKKEEKKEEPKSSTPALPEKTQDSGARKRASSFDYGSSWSSKDDDDDDDDDDWRSAFNSGSSFYGGK